MIETIRQLMADLHYEITLHARTEMDYDGISREDLLDALGIANNAVIEDYPEDRRGHSHLVLGWDSQARPIYACRAVHEKKLIVITVYRPDPERWDSSWSCRK